MRGGAGGVRGHRRQEREGTVRFAVKHHGEEAILSPSKSRGCRSCPDQWHIGSSGKDSQQWVKSGKKSTHRLRNNSSAAPLASSADPGAGQGMRLPLSSPESDWKELRD